MLREPGDDAGGNEGLALPSVIRTGGLQKRLTSPSSKLRASSADHRCVAGHPVLSWSFLHFTGSELQGGTGLPPWGRLTPFPMVTQSQFIRAISPTHLQELYCLRILPNWLAEAANFSPFTQLATSAMTSKPIFPPSV